MQHKQPRPRLWPRQAEDVHTQVTPAPPDGPRCSHGLGVLTPGGGQERQVFGGGDGSVHGGQLSGSGQTDKYYFRTQRLAGPLSAGVLVTP